MYCCQVDNGRYVGKVLYQDMGGLSGNFMIGMGIFKLIGQCLNIFISYRFVVLLV